MDKKYLFLFLGGMASLGVSQEVVGTANLPDDLAAANSPVKWVSKVESYCEGPAWVNNEFMIYSAPSIGGVKKYMASGVTSEFFTIDQPNGSEYANDGKIYHCAKGGVFSFKGDGTGKATLSAYTVENSAPPNDLTVDSKGNFYFTTWGAAAWYKPVGGPAKAVIPDGLKTANGIEFLEEKMELYIQESKANRCLKYKVAADGSVSGQTVFYNEVPEADGLTFDALGNAYLASYSLGEIKVVSPDGKLLGTISVKNIVGANFDRDPGPKGNTSNCAFGGKDFKTLYITGDGGLYAVDLKVAGRKRPGEGQVRIRLPDSHKIRGLNGSKKYGLPEARFPISKSVFPSLNEGQFSKLMGRRYP